MRLSSLYVTGYRSIRSVLLPLSQVNVLIGPNGCGKTNLYRSMYLLARTAEGRLAAEIAAEGGMPSVVWAGPRRKTAVRTRLAVKLDDFSYRLELGLSTDRARDGFFTLDPAIKSEQLQLMPDGARSATMIDRKNRSAHLRDIDGAWVPYRLDLLESESVLAQLIEPHRYPEVSLVRNQLAHWRFYHQFRTDLDAPIRQLQPCTLTPILHHTGYDLASALATVIELGRGDDLLTTIQDAFPAAQLGFDQQDGRIAVQLAMQGIQRPFAARELSDGTLRYLCLAAALLSPRPASLIALNEPETSLHPELIAPLARLIARAARDSQLWITTHSRALADHIAQLCGTSPIELEMVEGATRLVGAQEIDESE